MPKARTPIGSCSLKTPGAVKGGLSKGQGAGLGHLVGAGLIDGGVGRAGVGRNELIGQQKGLDLFAADVREHPAIDFDAGAEHLAAFLDHFLALGGVIDDVAVFEGEVVLAQDGPNPLAPSARGLQISNDFGFIHKFLYCHVWCHR